MQKAAVICMADRHDFSYKEKRYNAAIIWK